MQDAGDRRPRIDAALALGASPRQCTASVMRRSVRLDMVPVIGSTKTMGIAFLRGAVTAMILAGADPLRRSARSTGRGEEAIVNPAEPMRPWPSRATVVSWGHEHAHHRH